MEWLKTASIYLVHGAMGQQLGAELNWVVLSVTTGCPQAPAINCRSAEYIEVVCLSAGELQFPPCVSTCLCLSHCSVKLVQLVHIAEETEREEACQTLDA